MNAINFIDLKTQQQHILPDLEQRMKAVLAHGQYIMGPEIFELEEKLASYVGVSHCIAVASGTDALLIALMALGIGPGDEVITSPFTFIATGEVIAQVGATPVFVDIDPRTYNIDPAKIENAITSRTRVIMPVSLYGQCANFDSINTMVEKHNQSRIINRQAMIHVIEDACQSFGATFRGRRSCGLSTIGCTSFFPSKPLGCYGDGGACFTNDNELAVKMRQIRVHGQDRRYHHPTLGINGRMDTLQAAILLAKLSVFDAEVEARARIGARYTALIEDLTSSLVRGTPSLIIPPHIDPYNTCVYAQYTVQVENREEIQKRLQEQGIPTAVHYPVPLHLQAVFAGLNQPEGSFPVAESAAKKVMSLPMHPYLAQMEQDDIVTALQKAVSK
jgi:UDP-2-acetamido-2-deoxy-ribo-hexuluronate aminotransferase